MPKHQDRALGGAGLLISCFFLAMVVWPILCLLRTIGQTDLVSFLSRPMVAGAIANSAKVSLCAGLISLALALACAYAIARSGIGQRAREVFSALLIFPMLIPSLSHGTCLIILLGSNGILSRMLGLEAGLYGFWGIVAGSIMYAFPVAFLMILDVLQYEDSTPYEAAEVLGIPRWRQLAAISLPYLRKPLINTFFATFTLIVTDYGVPLMVGGTYKTLPVILYEEVIGRQDFAQGAALGALLLVPAVLAFLVDCFCRNRTGTGFVSRPFAPRRAPVRDVLARLALGAVSLCAAAPVLSFAAITLANRYPRDMSLTLRHVQRAIQRGVPDYLANSLTIAVFTALLGSVLAFLCAYLTARMPGRATRLLHLCAVSTLAIPGLVLGLSYVMAFKSTVIYSTMTILVLVNTVHFFSSPYLMAYNGLGKLNPNLEAVGATLGIGRPRMLKDVFFPQMLGTFLEMFSYFFVNSMMTISAVAFLANSDTKPLSLMINQFEAQTMLEAAAFVSLVIWAVNLTVKLLLGYAARSGTAKKGKAQRTEK